MKRAISLVAILLVLAFATCTLAEGMGVQIIGGADVALETVSLDDFKLNVEAVIDGYGRLTGTSFEFVDKLNYYEKGQGYGVYESGQDAEYAILRMDIINTATKARNFLVECEVKAVYDDIYEYAGWCYQCDYNDRKDRAYTEEGFFAIDPMYTGHYFFGCTLPNAVVEGKEPLCLIIKIDGNEITYNIRK